MASLPTYPLRLLCHGRLKKKILAGDIIGNCPGAVVGHWLEGPREKFIDGSLGEGYESLQMNAIPLERMANFSTNLLGGLFQYEDFHYRQVLDEPWDGKSDVDGEKAVVGNYVWMDEVTVIGWMLSDIHNVTLPYNRSFGKKKDYDAYLEQLAKPDDTKAETIYMQEWESLSQDPNNKKVRIIALEGHTAVNHDPRILNYWHFVIDIYPAENSDKPLPGGVSKGWQGKLSLSLQDILRNTFIDMKEGYLPPTLPDSSLWEA